METKFVNENNEISMVLTQITLTKKITVHFQLSTIKESDYASIILKISNYLKQKTEMKHYSKFNWEMLIKQIFTPSLTPVLVPVSSKYHPLYV